MGRPQGPARPGWDERVAAWGGATGPTPPKGGGFAPHRGGSGDGAEGSASARRPAPSERGGAGPGPPRSRGGSLAHPFGFSAAGRRAGGQGPPRPWVSPGSGAGSPLRLPQSPAVERPRNGTGRRSAGEAWGAGPSAGPLRVPPQGVWSNPISLERNGG